MRKKSPKNEPSNRYTCSVCHQQVAGWVIYRKTLTMAHKNKRGIYCSGGYLPVDKGDV